MGSVLLHLQWVGSMEHRKLGLSVFTSSLGWSVITWNDSTHQAPPRPRACPPTFLRTILPPPCAHPCAVCPPALPPGRPPGLPAAGPQTSSPPRTGTWREACTAGQARGLRRSTKVFNIANKPTSEELKWIRLSWRNEPLLFTSESYVQANAFIEVCVSARYTVRGFHVKHACDHMSLLTFLSPYWLYVQNTEHALKLNQLNFDQLVTWLW